MGRALCILDKRGKLSPRYIGPFKVLARIGLVAYTLELPEKLRGSHSNFHRSISKKCLAEGKVVVRWEEIQLMINYEEVPYLLYNKIEAERVDETELSARDGTP
ncbi:hypothetical protein Tco_0861605 [Tanacetum coccineum]|uniref:Tf2-1-like SH3-like domain-containing protein n=1 Tax=Tanacetum coccineum TaxID=301880 RepID=A0ABQ5BL93_9ASTR